MRNKMEVVRIKMGFDGMFVIDCHGRSRGLALLWKLKDQVRIQNYSKGHINDVVHEGNASQVWKLTGFYGNPETARRSESWALLRHLSRLSPEPWLLYR